MRQRRASKQLLHYCLLAPSYQTFTQFCSRGRPVEVLSVAGNTTKFVEPLSIEKVELFDGDESLYYNREVRVPILQLGEVAFNTKVFSPDNRLKYLEPIIGKEEFAQLLQTGNLKGPMGVTGDYYGTFELELYFLRFKEYIAVFAAGEKQPTRFMIYLEGIWKLPAQV